MFLYTVKYNESEYDILNINLLYKINQTFQTTFEQFVFLFSKLFVRNRNISNKSNFYLVFCIGSIIHFLQFLYFLVFWLFFGFFIFSIVWGHTQGVISLISIVSFQFRRFNGQNITPKVPYENCSHFWEIFRFFGGRTFSIFWVEKYL